LLVRTSAYNNAGQGQPQQLDVLMCKFSSWIVSKFKGPSWSFKKGLLLVIFKRKGKNWLWILVALIYRNEFLKAVAVWQLFLVR
jgi:hypothetical protein